MVKNQIRRVIFKYYTSTYVVTLTSMLYLFQAIRIQVILKKYERSSFGSTMNLFNYKTKDYSLSYDNVDNPLIRIMTHT